MTLDLNTLTTDALIDEALMLSKGLSRPLRYVQINSFYNGSTGTIMRGLHSNLIKQGVDSYIFWGRRHKTINEHEQCCASRLGVYTHGIKTRLFGRAGFYSKKDTRSLLSKLDSIQPDVIHLHNIHGYYINIEMLFDWLEIHNGTQVRWTLHDCWAFTGHCAHFSYVQCDDWKTSCAQSRPCPQLNTYPSTISKKSCEWNFKRKKNCFTRISPDRMILITPSHWLAGLVKQSYLSKYPIEVRNNTIDKEIFKETPSDFRIEYGINDRFMILGVASPWTERKGLNDFIKLANTLDNSKFAIVLVGLSKRQIRMIPKQIVALERTETAQELAAIYTAADIFFNPTKEDNYPTVNLEAEACGTPVITYDTGGCRETIKLENSACIGQGDLDYITRLAQGEWSYSA